MLNKYELYRDARGNLFIDNVTDAPVKEETLTEILNRLKSGDYKETFWNPKKKRFETISHK